MTNDKAFARPDQSGEVTADPRDHQRALFVPLKAQFFNAFADGSKNEELRRYGARWNERTCTVGRRVVLSKGYGRAHRLTGRIWKFKRQQRLDVRQHLSRIDSIGVRISQ